MEDLLLYFDNNNGTDYYNDCSKAVQLVFFDGSDQESAINLVNSVYKMGIEAKITPDSRLNTLSGTISTTKLVLGRNVDGVYEVKINEDTDIDSLITCIYYLGEWNVKAVEDINSSLSSESLGLLSGITSSSIENIKDAQKNLIITLSKIKYGIETSDDEISAAEKEISYLLELADLNNTPSSEISLATPTTEQAQNDISDTSSSTIYEKDSFTVGASQLETTAENIWYYTDTGGISAVTYIDSYNGLDDTAIVTNAYLDMYDIILNLPYKGMYNYTWAKEDGTLVGSAFRVSISGVGSTSMPIVWVGEFAYLNDSAVSDLYSEAWTSSEDTQTPSTPAAEQTTTTPQTQKPSEVQTTETTPNTILDGTEYVISPVTGAIWIWSEEVSSYMTSVQLAPFDGASDDDIITFCYLDALLFATAQKSSDKYYIYLFWGDTNSGNTLASCVITHLFGDTQISNNCVDFTNDWTHFNDYETNKKCIEIVENYEFNLVEDKFELDGFNVEFTGEYEFSTVENQFSEWNGKPVIKVAANIENVSSEYDHCMLYCTITDPNGEQLEKLDAYFDDGIFNFTNQIQKGSPTKGYFTIPYTVDGEYRFEFSDIVSKKCVYKINITKP